MGEAPRPWDGDVTRQVGHCQPEVTTPSGFPAFLLT